MGMYELGWGKILLMVGWMLGSILKFWRMSFRIAWSGGEKVLLISSFSRTMITSTLVNWPNLGSKIMEFGHGVACTISRSQPY